MGNLYTAAKDRACHIKVVPVKAAAAVAVGCAAGQNVGGQLCVELPSVNSIVVRHRERRAMSMRNACITQHDEPI